MRKSFDVGTATLASDLAIPGEANTTENKRIALLAGHAVCSDDKLPAV